MFFGEDGMADCGGADAGATDAVGPTAVSGVVDTQGILETAAGIVDPVFEQPVPSAPPCDALLGEDPNWPLSLGSIAPTTIGGTSNVLAATDTFTAGLAAATPTLDATFPEETVFSLSWVLPPTALVSPSASLPSPSIDISS